MAKLTAELQNRLCAHIAEGMNQSDVCTVVGINRKTLYNWLAKGKAKETDRYTDFYTAYQLAVQSSYQSLIQQLLEGDSQVRTELDADGNVIKIVRTETRSWRQAAWLLEKRFPHLFGEQTETPTALAETSQPPNYAALFDLIKQFEENDANE